jgi:hypothetical protein
MSGPAGRSGGTGPVARAVALLVAAGCFGAIAWSARERPTELVRPPSPSEPPAAAAIAAPARSSPIGADACRAAKEAEIAAIRTEGELTAERRMRIRQVEARACE